MHPSEQSVGHTVDGSGSGLTGRYGWSQPPSSRNNLSRVDRGTLRRLAVHPRLLGYRDGEI